MTKKPVIKKLGCEFHANKTCLKQETTFFHQFLKNNQMKKHITLLIVIMYINSAVYANPNDTLSLEKKLSILNDRAFMFFPSMAKILPSPANKNNITNIEVAHEDAKLIFHFEELFMIGDSNLYTQVLNGDKKIFPVQGYSNLLFYTLNSSSYDFKRKLVPNKDGLISILSSPQRYLKELDNILLNMLLVKTHDNTLFMVEVFTNEKGFIIKDQLIELSEKVFQTLLNGTRTNNRNARVEYYEDNLLNTNKFLRFDLPANYFITVKDNGERFTIHKYTNFADSSWCTFSIYVVSPGVYDYGEDKDLYGIKHEYGVRVKGKFLKSKVDWITYSSETKKAFIKKENFDPNDIGIEGPYIHIFMATDSASSMKEMTEILESKKLKRKPLRKKG